MATGVFEGIGVALAIPGVIDVIVRGGVVVYEKIDTFRKMDQTMANFRDISLDVKQGTLYFGLQNVRATSSDRLIPEAIKNQLDKNLNDLQHELTMTRHILSSVHEDTVKSKLAYTLWRGKGSKHQLDRQYETLRASCDKVKDLCLQLYTYRTAESSYLLTADVFKLFHETADDQAGKLLPNSDIVIAPGNYVERGSRKTAEFILEKKSRENDVRYLCSKLQKDDLANKPGICPSLGYRQPPYNDLDGSKMFQLIFELPQDVRTESLAHLICTQPQPQLVDRLRLCQDLTQSVKSIHSLELVHKSLRPRSVLLLSALHGTDASRKLFIHDWTFVREFEGATTKLGESSWQKRIYQHPERQGKYADVAYLPKHDIYSLGVCMLEILLWTPFVTHTKTSSARSELTVCEMFETYGLNRGENNGGLPLRYKGDAIKLTSKSWVTKTIWSDIASSKLDVESSQLVLKCMDDVFQDATEVLASIKAVIKARQKP